MISEMVSIAYGTVTMVSWGAGDVVAKKIVGRIGYHRLLLYAYTITLPLILALAGLFPPKPADSPMMVALVVLAGVFRFLTALFFFRALSVGKASIIAPVVSTSTVVAVVLSFMILGESLGSQQLTFVVLALVGMFMLSARPGATGGDAWSGVPYALIATLAGGIDSVLIKIVSLGIGRVGALVSNHLVVAFMLLVTSPLFRHSAEGPRARLPVVPIVLFALAEFIGFLAFVFGTSAGMVSIVVPVASASPAVTVILARFLLGERLIRIHKIAVVLVITGVALLSITSV